MADPIGWIAEGKPAENEAFMVFGKRTEYACVPVEFRSLKGWKPA